MRAKLNQKFTPSILTLSSGIDYELLDIGNQRKLERFGTHILDRPEVEAKAPKRLPAKEWEKADFFFYEEKGKKGRWSSRKEKSKNWDVSYQNRGIKLEFDLKLTAFKHIGLFPEQAENWKYIQHQLAKINGEKKVLNLFAYTGAASIVAARSGATVTNVDSVKQVLNWGRANAEKNNVDSIRWILEDARKFVAKAIRRGETYHGIIMDPPAFGYGTKNEKWKLENDLEDLLKDAIQLLHPKQHFFILNTYSPKLPLSDLMALLEKIKQFPKSYEAHTLSLKSRDVSLLKLGNLIRFKK